MQNQKKVLFSNFLSLSALQIVNYILPLVTLPYLVRVLGVEYFGLLAFATATVSYFSIITDYGFNLSATKEISTHKENKTEVIQIFSSVMSIKFLLMIFSFLLLNLLIFSFDKFEKEWEIFYFSFGIVVGQMLFPVWFFQGMQKMQYITYINVIFKVLVTISIFVFIQEKTDYFLVPILNAFGFIFSGLSAQILVRKSFGITYKMQSILNLKKYFQEGWHIFVGTIGISFYKNNAILILGLFTDNVVVGYFSVAKRIVDAFNQFAALVSQSIYPHVCNELQENSSTVHTLLQKIGVIIVLFTLMAGAIILLYSENIINLISGYKHYESILSLQIMAFVPFLIGINVPAVQLLLGTSNNREFSRTVLTGAILDIFLNLLLVPYFSYVGSSITVVVVEFFVTSYLYVKVYKLKLFRRLF